MTLVSLGLPVYNGEKYLDEALSSALAQTHTELEIVISDNGSTDATESICRRWAALDSRIVYVRHDVNRGASFNHNYVVTSARGDYFRWYAYDDRLEPRCIAACAEVLDAEPDVVLVWPQTYVMDETSRVVSEYRTDLPWDAVSPSGRLAQLLSRPTDESLLHMCYPVYGVIRREVLLQTRLLRPFNAADDVLLVELALRGRWYQVPQRLFYNRRHAESSVGVKSPEEIAQWFLPDRRVAYPMPRTTLLRGYVTAVGRTPLPITEKIRCWRVIGGWVSHDRRWRVLLGEFRIRGRQLGTRLTPWR